MVYYVYGTLDRDVVLITQFFLFAFSYLFFIIIIFICIVLGVHKIYLNALFFLYFFFSLYNLFDDFVLKINLVENWVFYFGKYM